MANKLLPSNSIILIVDPSESSRTLLNEKLHQLGYHYIIEAEGSNDAMAKLEVGANTGSPITLVLCDWKAANIKGLDFLKKMREASFSTETPVIIISSNYDLSHVLLGVSKHINGYIIKPYTQQSLESNIEAALSGIKL
jgi:two-component system chemotaxis response regulator CheY